MKYIYKNITGNTAVNIARRIYEYNYTHINLCNVHASDSVLIDLYIVRRDKEVYDKYAKPTQEELADPTGPWSATPYKDPKARVDGEDGEQNRMEDGSYQTDPSVDYITSTYYILKNVTIPFGQTLSLSKEDLCYEFSKYNLFLKLNAGDSAVDVIIKTEINDVGSYIPTEEQPDRKSYRSGDIPTQM